jgi:hypothetical protein
MTRIPRNCRNCARCSWLVALSHTDDQTRTRCPAYEDTEAPRGAEPEAGCQGVTEGRQVTGEAPEIPLGATDKAIVWLSEVLANGPQLAREVEQQAREAGIPSRTYFRARRVLGVVARRCGGLAGKGHWALTRLGRFGSA